MGSLLSEVQTLATRPASGGRPWAACLLRLLHQPFRAAGFSFQSLCLFLVCLTAVFAVGSVIGASVGDNVGATFGDVVDATVGDAVGATVGDDIVATVGSVVGISVGDDVGATVGDAVGAAVGDAVGAAVGETVGRGLLFLEKSVGTDFSPTANSVL